MGYNVYNREVISPAEKSKWNSVTVSRNTTNYTLHLNCRKQYEIAVTSLIGQRESEMIDSRVWNFNTRGGNASVVRSRSLGHHGQATLFLWHNAFSPNQHLRIVGHEVQKETRP